MGELNLHETINNAITRISEIADKFPGVVIIHDLRDWSVRWMSKRGLDRLGISLEEVTALTASEYYSRFFNEEDSKDYVPKILKLLESNNDEEVCTYFQPVRLKQQEDWTWHMSSTKILERDEARKPVLTITMAFPIDAMHHMVSKAERLLQENNFLRKHYHQFDKLSKREKQILTGLAIGKSSSEIADELFISVNTVDTHRKNIRQKLKTNSHFELTQYARAFDLI